MCLKSPSAQLSEILAGVVLDAPIQSLIGWIGAMRIPEPIDELMLRYRVHPCSCTPHLGVKRACCADEILVGTVVHFRPSCCRQVIGPAGIYPEVPTKPVTT